MSANLDGAQAAVIGILAVVRAVVDGAVDALVGGTLAASPGLVFAARRKLCIGFAGRKIFAGGRFGFAEFQPWMNAMSIGNRDIVIFFVADIVDSKMLAVLAGICFHDNHLTVIIK